jgi:phage/plasmid-associated DNA primase
MINVIAENKVIPGLNFSEFWEARPEMPAIFNWALAGLSRLMGRGTFLDAGYSKEIKERLRIESATELEFFSECIVLEPGATLYKDHLRKAFNFWCEAQNIRPLDMRFIFKRLREVYPDTREKRLDETGRPRIFTNLRLETPLEMMLQGGA